MSKYKVTRESFDEVLEDYGIMNIDELRKFLSQFVDESYKHNLRIRDGYVYNSQEDLEKSIKFIKEEGSESLIDTVRKPGSIEIVKVLEGDDVFKTNRFYPREVKDNG